MQKPPFIVAIMLTGAAGAANAADVTPNLAGAPAGWTTDRYQPPGFTDVGTFQGHPDTLGITIDSTSSSANRPAGLGTTFYNTQGMSMPISGGVGDSVSLDLYVPGSWLNPNQGARRTDMWLFVNDPASLSDPRDYPIIGFTNNDTTGDGFVGFRAWNSLTGAWDNFDPITSGDEWYNLTITDLPGNLFQYSVDGVIGATIAGDPTDTTFADLALQAYNFGDPSLGNSPVVNDYTADWANPVPEPASVALLGFGLLSLAAIRRRKRGS
jgi:hypothetical protein